MISGSKVFIEFQVTPHANGRNTVGQQFPALLYVTCCVRLHTLLHVVRVVGSCCAKFETGQTSEPTTPNNNSNDNKTFIINKQMKLKKYCPQLARLFEAGQYVQNIKLKTKAVNQGEFTVYK